MSSIQPGGGSLIGPIHGAETTSTKPVESQSTVDKGHKFAYLKNATKEFFKTFSIYKQQAPETPKQMK